MSRRFGDPMPLWRLAMPSLVIALLATIGYLAGGIGDPAGEGTVNFRNDYGLSLPVLAALGYVSVLLAAALLWGLRVRHETQRLLGAAHEVVDGAMRGEPRRMGYTESELSLLEHKLTRFAEVSRERESEAAEAKDVIQRLVADISHQTKTPLSNMLLYTELLQERLEYDAVGMAWIGEVRGQADRLHFLIRSLVEMSRLETGIVALRPVTAPLMDAVNAAVTQASSAAASANVTLIVEPSNNEEASAPTAHYDPKWTAEALFNLLDNAMKYGRTGGTVRITLSTGDVYAQIDIADDGPGIADEDAAALFGRFRRGKNAGRIEGVGLGLYLAREIVQHQGGRIQAGPSPEGGALFRVFLPR